MKTKILIPHNSNHGDKGVVDVLDHIYPFRPEVCLREGPKIGVFGPVIRASE